MKKQITFILLIVCFIPVISQAQVNSRIADGNGVAEKLSWGQEYGGLKCAVAAPNDIEQNMSLVTSVRLQCIPDHLEKGVKQLNTFMRDAFLTLHLSNVSSQKSYSVKPYDPTLGMLAIDNGSKTIFLDGNSIAPWEVKFPLLTLRNALEPGLYQCKVEYSFPKEPNKWWDKANNKSWNSYGFWNGTIYSAPFQLRILKESPKTIKVLLPQKLHYYKDGKIINYTKKDAVETKLPVRNGYFSGTKVYYPDPNHEK
jgi:hypothetical protein